MNLEHHFKELRREWFRKSLYIFGPERESEHSDVEVLRAQRNGEMWRIYNEQTEEIIDGADHPVAPKCYDDLCVSRC